MLSLGSSSDSEWGETRGQRKAAGAVTQAGIYSGLGLSRKEWLKEMGPLGWWIGTRALRNICGSSMGQKD